MLKTFERIYELWHKVKLHKFYEKEITKTLSQA